MRHVLLALAASSALLVACDSAESQRIEQTRSTLVGTWLREAESGSIKHRRVLVLGTDGKFTERLSAIEAGGGVETVEFAGEWSYDGANLKRRFMEQNGRRFSGGKIRYATFALVSSSRFELVVDDNIVGEKVSYRRVAEGTQP